MSVLEPKDTDEYKPSRPRGEKQKAGPRPKTELLRIKALIWHLMLTPVPDEEILEEMESEYDLPRSTTRFHITKLRRRLEEVQHEKQVEVWSRQMRRLEMGATRALAQERYEAQAMLEDKLAKVAGTYAPEKFLHLHAEVNTVDQRALELDAQLRSIAAASDGPKALAHEVTSAQHGAFEILPNKPPEELPERRALRGRAPGRVDRVVAQHERVTPDPDLGQDTARTGQVLDRVEPGQASVGTEHALDNTAEAPPPKVKRALPARVPGPDERSVEACKAVLAAKAAERAARKASGKSQEVTQAQTPAAGQAGPAQHGGEPPAAAGLAKFFGAKRPGGNNTAG
jgi:hypothetical protein